MEFNDGDTVRFLVPFRNADTIIEVGCTGVISRGKPILGFVSVIAKEQLWLCKPREIERIDQMNANPPVGLVNRETRLPPTADEWEQIKRRAMDIFRNPYASPESLEWAIDVYPEGFDVLLTKGIDP